MQTKNSPLLYCNENIYKTFFFDGKCFFPTTENMVNLYHLDANASENDKIILVNEIQENELLNEGYVYDGYQERKIDNLNHVFVRKYKLITEEGKKTATTDLSDICDENYKYSYLLGDLIMHYLYIEHLSFESISKLLKYNYDLEIDYRRVCDIYNKTADSYILKRYEDVENDIRNGKIKLGHVGNYDEEFVYVKHQPYVRLALIDNKTKIIIKDILIPRKIFDRNFIKSFLEEATEGLNYHTIVTDGDKRYKKILEELGINQQRCIFHSMQNLMSKVNPVHNRLKRRIKTINKKIKDKEKDLEPLIEKSKGYGGRPKKGDKQRKKDIAKKKQLKREISELKAEKRKHKNHIAENEKYIKKISRILKSSTYETGIKNFKELWDIKDSLSDEIRRHLISLKNYLPEALLHTRLKDVPRTNNLIESFFKATLPRKIKYIFMTYDGLMKRILLADLRWIQNHITPNRIKQ